MEKLIKLLNEWKVKSYVFYIPDGADKVHRKETDAYGNLHVSCIKNCELISKEFGFIKWLVDNHKIDFSWEGDLVSELVVLFDRVKDDDEGVIALLSIQDEPIEFLISILK